MKLNLLLPTLMTLGLATATPAAHATLYTFGQTGFDGGGVIRGSFEATDANSDNWITRSEVSAFSLSFSGDSIIPDFSQSLAELDYLNYHISTYFLGDEIIGAFQEVIGTNWSGSTGFSYASGIGAGGFGGSVTNLDTAEVSYSDNLAVVPLPGTLWLIGVGLFSRRFWQRSKIG